MPRRTSAEIFKSKRGWRFRIVAGNGEIIAASEGYTRRDSACRGAKRLYPTAVQKPGRARR